MQAPNVLHQPPGYSQLHLCMSVKTYIAWDIQTKPGITQFQRLIQTYPGYPKIKQKQMGYHRKTQN